MCGAERMSLRMLDARSFRIVTLQPRPLLSSQHDELSLLRLRMAAAAARELGCPAQGKYGNLDASVVSYGPCQTPTLAFCVERHQRIAAFQPEPFWVVRPHALKQGQQYTPPPGHVLEQSVLLHWQQITAACLPACLITGACIAQPATKLHAADVPCSSAHLPGAVTAGRTAAASLL